MTKETNGASAPKAPTCTYFKMGAKQTNPNRKGKRYFCSRLASILHCPADGSYQYSKVEFKLVNTGTCDLIMTRFFTLWLVTD